MNTHEKHIAIIFSHNWWVLLLRGISAIIFGILTWVLPGVTLAMLALLFSVYVFMDGVLGVWTAFVGRKEPQWWVFLLWGLAGIGIGIMTILRPGVTAMGLLFFIAIWASTTGILEIVAAIRLRKEIQGEWLLILGGLASLAFGVFLIARPLAGVITLLWLIGTYAVVFGVILVILAFKSRSFDK